ncbi:hypothetical protein FRX31_033462 [Thalictrum thalictroides]|uniref:Uncharacterized protein n=1 Tax=Thalictrum thalictroides TaxID=46969 RepID=A0A7J6UWS6_THATH|nr:hypothetical protein FRX31_033462 [Thalictrum thalictroides]
MGKRKRDSISTKSKVINYTDDLLLETRRMVQRHRRRHRMCVIRNKRLRGIGATTPIHSNRLRIPRRYVVRANNMLVSCSGNVISDSIPRRLDVDEYDNVFQRCDSGK